MLERSAIAFVPAGTNASDSRWQSTASGSTGVAGDPVTLTWGFVPDQTAVLQVGSSSGTAPSKLISTFDATFGAGPGGSDLTTRPWFRFFDQSFQRWSELAGVTYVYEPNDSGQQHGTIDGVLGVRADVRIGGIGMDGIGDTLAYSYFPSGGADLALDTDDLAQAFADPSDDYRTLRNTIMHEAGHGLGLEHSSSGDANFLMEFTIDSLFDGPQHDDLRGIHWMYGDVFEKNGRNETAATATSLGSLAVGGTLQIGAGGTGSAIAPTETDFVSITNENDNDLFAFSITEPIRLDATMTPRGATYLQGSTPFVTTETSNLSLAILDSDGSTILINESSGEAGITEQVTGFALTSPGTYYARVRGPQAANEQVTQFYQLDLSATALLPELPGDFNGDGFVDAADYSFWRDREGMSVGLFSSADHSGDGVIDEADYLLWRTSYGTSLDSPAIAVPEPASLLIVILGTTLFAGHRRARA